jgi:hypothetical protein
MKKLRVLMILGIGTFILMLIGFYNGYPLVYSDTGTYIYSGFDKFIPIDRPITYGLFVKIFSFNYSLWFVILFQNFITAFVIYELLKTIKIANNRFNFFYLSVLTFLMLFTGLAWYSNQIMPDFFTPVFILVIFILLKRENYSWFTKVILCLILIYALITHFSHLLIASVLIGFVVILKFAVKRKFNDIALKNLLAVSIIIFSSWFVLAGINYKVEKKFILSKASHVFIMAHLDDTGILEKYLKENCSKIEYKDCKICQYKDSLTGDLGAFIWSGKILEKTGGWVNSKDDYNKIIKGTLTTPNYLFLNIFKSFNYGLIQLTKNQIGQGLTAYNQGSAPYQQIHWRFYDELTNYLNSRQNKWNGGNLKLDDLNLIHLVILILSLFIVIYLYTSSVLAKLESTTVLFLIFVIMAIVINSFITAGLNSPCERFQARVVWLLPFSLIILIYQNYNEIIKSIRNKE